MPILTNLLNQVMTSMAERMQSDKPVGLTSGLPQVDEAIGGGFIRQQLSYLVGDSGVGKSWLASFFAIQGARALATSPSAVPISGYLLTGSALSDLVKLQVLEKTNKQPLVIYWSLEMSEFPVVVRMLTQVAANFNNKLLNSKSVLQGKFSPDEKEAFVGAYQTAQDTVSEYLYLEFNDDSVDKFRRTLDALTVMYDIVLIVVDYFSLIDEVALDGTRVSTQEARSGKLREIAKNYDCHVLSLFDINRAGQLAGGQPHRYHMKDGTKANYDADLVITLGTDKESEEAMRLAGLPERRLFFTVEKGRWAGEGAVQLMLNVTNGFVYERTKEESSQTTFEKESEGGMIE